MKNALLAAVVAIGLGVACCAAQVGPAGTNAPPDKPLAGDAAALDALTKPYAEMAKKSYPAARDRFLAGLPPKHAFLVSARVFAKTGSFEQIFVAVREIADGKIKGRIASDVQHVPGYRLGDPFECREADISDWVITGPDGSEEGNLVGKFLDAVQERRSPLILQMVVDGAGVVTTAKFHSAVNQSKQDISYCIPDEVKREAERLIAVQRYDPAGSIKTNYTYLFYDWLEKRIEPLKEASPAPAGKTTTRTAPAR